MYNMTQSDLKFLFTILCFCLMSSDYIHNCHMHYPGINEHRSGESMVLKIMSNWWAFYICISLQEGNWYNCIPQYQVSQYKTVFFYNFPDIKWFLDSQINMAISLMLPMIQYFMGWLVKKQRDHWTYDVPWAEHTMDSTTQGQQTQHYLGLRNI